MSTTIDEKLARIRGRVGNIRRYRRLLQTELTEIERDFVVKRLSEEQEALSSSERNIPHNDRSLDKEQHRISGEQKWAAFMII